MKYVTYLPETGEIKTWGECDVPMPLDGHGVVLEDADGSAWTHYVVKGALVAYTPAQVAAKAAIPDYPATWSNASFAWVDARSLDQALTDTMDALTTAYASAIAQPVAYTTTGGVTQTFQADPAAIDNVSRSMLGCQATQATPPGFFWNALDNTHVPFAYADLQGLASAIFAQGATAFARLQTLKARARAATTNNQLRGITWATS